MKKSLLLLASMLMSAASFAQWTEPAAPAFVPMAEDGETINYLYNIEAKGFFLGANDWNTRASVSKTKGYKVKMIQKEACTEYGETHQHWSIVDSVETQKEWKATFAENPQAIWVDNNAGANFDQWVVVAQGNNVYKIYNCGASMGAASQTLGMAEIFEGKKGNTRLWLFDPTLKYTYETEDGEEAEAPKMQGEFYDKWAFVSPAEYEAYIPKVTQYNAAMNLKDAIATAKEETPQANYSAAEAIYNNTASTAVELDSARTILVPKAIADYKKTLASVDSPANMTDLLESSDFETGIAGWQFTTGAQNKGAATNKANQNDFPGTTFTGSFLENWNGGSFAGKIYYELNAMPGGVYQITMDAMADGGKDTWVYANSARTRTGGVDKDGNTGLEMCGTGYKFTVFTTVGDDGKLELGLENASASTNWIGIDNVSVLYYGDEFEAYKLWYNSERASIIAAMGVITPETHYNRSLQEPFKEALAIGDGAQTKEEISKAIETLYATSEEALTSVEAYHELEKVIDEIIEYLDKNDEVYGLIEYFNDFVRLTSDDDGKGDLETLAEEIANVKDGDKVTLVEYAPAYVLNEGVYTTEEVLKYAADLRALYEFCNANSLVPGQDFTSVLKNPRFTDPNGGGWTIAQKGGNFSLYGGIVPDQEKSVGMPVAECWHGKFEIYQEVSAPDGIYSVSLNGFCRLESGRDDIPAEIYLNEFATKFMNYWDGGVAEADAVDGFNVFNSSGMSSKAITENPQFMGCKIVGPGNGPDKLQDGMYYPDGMAGAGVAFAAGRYEAKVYGIVEGGKMKIGVRNLKSDGEWVLWSNFKVTYEGVNEEAVDALAEIYVAKANEYLEANTDNMTSAMADKIAAAIKAVEDGKDAESMYAALKDLNALVATEAPIHVEAVTAFNSAMDALTAALEEFGETASSGAIAAAEALLDASVDGKNTDEIKAITKEIETAAAALRIPASDDASDDNPLDMTQVIINPDFEANEAGKQATGWTLVKGEGAEGNYQVQNGFTETGAVSMEFWSNTNGSGTKFDFYQEIAGLPAGTYMLTANAANSYNGQAAGPGEGAAYIYAAAGQNGKLTYTDNGMIVPQEAPCNGADQRFSNYSVIFTVAEGDVVRIGAMNVGELPARWVMIDDFTLTYYGANSSKTPSTGHETVIKDAQTTSVAAGIYSISGAKLNSLKKGINIVKGADGSVRKIFVK